MNAARAGVLITLAAVAAGCRPEIVPPNDQSVNEPTFARGGIPGPPSHVIVAAPKGPANAPVPLPPQAGPPSFLADVIDIGAGNQLSCALRSDGVAYCWGNAILGDGSQGGSAVPVEVSGPQRYVRLAVGDVNACGLTAAGDAWCWGDNARGQLGAGLSAAFSLTPVAVSGGLRFIDLDTGLRTMCGVATDGASYCWGENGSGQLGLGSVGGIRNVPVAVTNSAALGFVDVDVGFTHACGLTGTGELYCWGSSSHFGNGAVGGNVPTPTPSAGGARFAAISAGVTNTCGLDATGAGTCWGTLNGSGQLGIGSFAEPILAPASIVGIPSFAALDAFDNNSLIQFTCGLVNNAAWCWGANGSGQLGSASSAVCNVASSAFSCSSVPLAVGGGLTFLQVAVGADHACGRDAAGNAWCWGNNAHGGLGDGTMVSSMTPVQVRGLTAPQQSGWIVVSPGNARLRLLGSTQQFAALAVDENGVPLAVQPAFAWTSSDAAAAPIDASGIATALVDAVVTITATGSNGQSGRAVLTVQIIDPVAAFQTAWGSADGVVVLGGLLADEWGHSGTFPTRREVDQRSIAATNQTVELGYGQLAFALTALEFEAARLMSSTPGDPRIGQMLALAGYVTVGFAENFCSGVPLSDPDVGLTTQALFNRALVQFADALAQPIGPPYDLLARIGRARANLGVGNFAAAAAEAGMVPTPFTFALDHSAAVPNGVWALSLGSPRITVSDVEGGNGLPFRSPPDSRVPWAFTGPGFNGVTPHFALLKYPNASSDLIVGSGLEARLIEAEAALAGGNLAQYLALLNAVRAQGGLPPLGDPGTTAARQDLLFSERAFWLFATGQRLGDLRRLIGSYGRSAAAVFPVGAYPLPSGLITAYGTDANLPVPASARGPGFTGCTDRGS